MDSCFDLVGSRQHGVASYEVISWSTDIHILADADGDDLVNRRGRKIEVTSWLVSADDFSSRVARGANERVSAANE